jgi:hypothetical protein
LKGKSSPISTPVTGRASKGSPILHGCLGRLKFDGFAPPVVSYALLMSNLQYQLQIDSNGVRDANSISSSRSRTQRSRIQRESAAQLQRTLVSNSKFQHRHMHVGPRFTTWLNSVCAEEDWTKKVKTLVSLDCTKVHAFVGLKSCHKCSNISSILQRRTSSSVSVWSLPHDSL